MRSRHLDGCQNRIQIPLIDSTEDRECRGGKSFPVRNVYWSVACALTINETRQVDFTQRHLQERRSRIEITAADPETQAALVVLDSVGIS